MDKKKEREYMTLSVNGDYFEITTPTEAIVGDIDKAPFGLYYCNFSRKHYNNIFLRKHYDYIFEKALMREIGSFQEEVLGYSNYDGIFPYCRTREDVIKPVKAVVAYNNMRVPGNKKHKGSLSLRQREHIKFNFNL